MPFNVVGSGAAARWWQLHGVPLLTYVLCTEEASDVLRRVALRRPDMLVTGTSLAATSAATSDVGSSSAKRVLPGAGMALY
jgi:hypothetical protein